MQTTADLRTAHRSPRQRAAPHAGRASTGRRGLALAPPGLGVVGNAQALQAVLAHGRRPGALPAAVEQALVTGTEDPARRVVDDMLAQREPTASGSEARPELEALADDAVVDKAIAADWKASNPNGPGTKQERGFWVLKDGAGKLSVQAFPSNGTRDSLTPGAMPASAIAFFHTHPNTSAEGYQQAPSGADIRFANAKGIPGLVMSHDGMFYFGPALK